MKRRKKKLCYSSLYSFCIRHTLCWFSYWESEYESANSQPTTFELRFVVYLFETTSNSWSGWTDRIWAVLPDYQKNNNETIKFVKIERKIGIRTSHNKLAFRTQFSLYTQSRRKQMKNATPTSIAINDVQVRSSFTELQRFFGTISDVWKHLNIFLSFSYSIESH